MPLLTESAPRRKRHRALLLLPLLLVVPLLLALPVFFLFQPDGLKLGRQYLWASLQSGKPSSGSSQANRHLMMTTRQIQVGSIVYTARGSRPIETQIRYFPLGGYQVTLVSMDTSGATGKRL